MSRSFRKPIVKDKPRNFKASTYYRRIRRVIKQLVKMLEEELPDPKSIVNPYDYMDWRSDLRDSKDIEQKTKWSRK